MGCDGGILWQFVKNEKEFMDLLEPWSYSLFGIRGSRDAWGSRYDKVTEIEKEGKPFVFGSYGTDVMRGPGLDGLSSFLRALTDYVQPLEEGLETWITFKMLLDDIEVSWKASAIFGFNDSYEFQERNRISWLDPLREMDASDPFLSQFISVWIAKVNSLRIGKVLSEETWT